MRRFYGAYLFSKGKNSIFKILINCLFLRNAFKNRILIITLIITLKVRSRRLAKTKSDCSTSSVGVCNLNVYRVQYDSLIAFTSSYTQQGGILELEGQRHLFLVFWRIWTCTELYFMLENVDNIGLPKIYETAKTTENS